LGGWGLARGHARPIVRRVIGLLFTNPAARRGVPGICYVKRHIAFPLGPIIGPPGEQMKTVAEYRKLAEECRNLAAKLSNLKDKKSLEMIAAAWDAVANEREGRGDK
jgi:hypothetical protein